MYLAPSLPLVEERGTGRCGVNLAATVARVAETAVVV